MKNLETNNLILRKFKLDDYVDMYNNWASYEKVARSSGFPVHTNISDTKELVEYWVNEYKDNNVFNWIIVLKDTKEAIGSISVVNKDLKNKVCEIGYNIGPNWWNNGFATESLKEVINYLFENSPFEVLTANCHSYNIASSKVLEKCGLENEGILRNRILIDGKRYDLMQFSISKDN